MCLVYCFHKKELAGGMSASRCLLKPRCELNFPLICVGATGKVGLVVSCTGLSSWVGASWLCHPFPACAWIRLFTFQSPVCRRTSVPLPSLLRPEEERLSFRVSVQCPARRDQMLGRIWKRCWRIIGKVGSFPFFTIATMSCEAQTQHFVVGFLKAWHQHRWLRAFGIVQIESGLPCSRQGDCFNQAGT